MRFLVVSMGCLIAFGTPTTSTRAQRVAAQPEAGTWVRVHVTGGPKIEGFFVRVHNDTLVLDAARLVPVEAVAGLEVRARERRGRARWAFYGLVVGAAAGAVWCGVERTDCMANSTDQNTFGEGLRAATYGGALVGALAGTIYGAGRVDRWRAVPLSVLRR